MAMHFHQSHLSRGLMVYISQTRDRQILSSSRTSYYMVYLISEISFYCCPVKENVWLIQNIKLAMQEPVVNSSRRTKDNENYL